MFTPALMVLAAAHAAGPESNGTYSLTDSPSQVQQFKEAAVKKTLASMNFAIRAVAGSRVESAVTACSAYNIEFAGSAMKVKCDAKPWVTINLDGTSGSYTDDQGVTYAITAARSGDKVTATFTGEDASQTTVYDFSGGQLAVHKTINSPYFGEPLRWTNRYQK